MAVRCTIMEKIISIRLLVCGCVLLLSLATATPTPIPSAENSTTATTHMLLNEVIVGVRVLHRHATNQVSDIENHYPSAQSKRGFYALSMLFHSLQTINILQQSNVSSNNLTIFNVVIEGVLDDTCRWFSSIDSDIDCSDRSSFMSTLLAMGLTPHLSKLNCFLTSLDHFSGGQEQGPWVKRTFAATEVVGRTESQNLKTRFCSDVNINCSAE